MKNLFSLLMLCLAFSASAQNISEVTRTMSQGNKSGLLLELEGLETKLVEKLWMKFVKDYDGKTKQDRRSGEFFTDDVDVPNISNNSIDMYSTFEAVGEGTEACVFFDLGGAYLNAAYHGDKFKEGENFLMLFAKEVEREKVKIQLDEEEKSLKGMEKELKRLERAKENLNKEIEEAKKKIAEAEAGIVENDKLQVSTNEQIEKQIEKVKEVQKKLSDF